ncbi:MAG TPA: type II secretion system protein [Candidatus Sumerlaeota bacterium]|nr:type II secretion system protein [Candidatus Sumerlaeota bacterium]
MRTPFLRLPSGRGFVLLEVILCILILGLSMGAFLRSFTVSLNTARKSQILTTATLLAQQVLEEYEVIPPQGNHEEGSFVGNEGDYDEDNFPNLEKAQYKNYYWSVDMEEILVEYPDASFEGDTKDFENLTKMTVSIIYNDKNLRHFIPIKVTTYLTNAEKFTNNSKRENKLY